MTHAPRTVDAAAFREAMARFASGVTVVTARSARDGRLAGFTASAFSSLSLDPPLVLVCLDRRADSYRVFSEAEAMAVSVLAHGQHDLALHFASKGIDKFSGRALERGEATGLPLIPGALAHIECAMHDRLEGGDHVILVGRVLRAAVGEGEPLVHYNRAFGRFVRG
ncbi:p-hydroxyphenylacetate 3-hydroxylase, reductase component [bacterium HR29]|jgi:flavin reductase ActVB|nr:p-hydroxyphenylacetate 3-hydroxylase, reductase component [bacterium HR29]